MEKNANQSIILLIYYPTNILFTMLESYKHEVMRKRRAARIFWLIVFVCAWFLYFFFQGYYPDIRVGLRLFSESEGQNYTGSNNFMRSFGIINVRAIPTDASIFLGSGSYGNNEKRMSDYGNYTMRIEKPEYLTNSLEFSIDSEKPFFIEKISLLPIPVYKKINGIDDIYHLSDGESLLKTASGRIKLESTGKYISYTWSLEYIGKNYFLTNTWVLIWENNTLKKTSPDISNFVQTCQDIKWKYDLFYCQKSKSILTEWGKYLTGILDIRDHMIEQSWSITEIIDGNLGKSWTQTGEINLNNIAITHGKLYTTNSGILIPRDQTQEIIKTPLNIINHVSDLEEDIIFIWTIQWKTHIIIKHLGDPLDRMRDIPFPEHLSYSDIEIHTLGGNILIQAPRGILFNYRGSKELQWIAEWDILSFTDTGALYRKNGEIWNVDWSEKL